jgi:glycosyltransferase involved in cell wall biosynthesis
MTPRQTRRLPPRCSVIIPTYNRSWLLRHTLDSLVCQSLPRHDFEVVVVDDGSSDDTAELVCGYVDRLSLQYLFQEDQGYRVALARNVGIRHARSEICVFVDSGVLLHSGALAAHVASHEASNTAVAVCGYVYCFNENNEDGALIEKAVDYSDPDAAIADLVAAGAWPDIREEFYSKYGDDFADLPAPWLVFWTCNASAPTRSLAAVGMFDESFKSWGGEDVDLSYRLHRAGVRFMLNRRASSIHCPHPKSYEANMRSAAGNYRYIAAKYANPIAELVVDNHFFLINDIIAERGLTA